jgi:protein gp37
MHSALEQFRANLSRARELGALAYAIEHVTTTVIDVSDIWRSQIVLGVSAFDHFIHEFVQIEMIEVSKGNRPKTDAFNKFLLPLEALQNVVSGQLSHVWLGDYVREKHSWQSFQHPDKIAEAIRLISEVPLWQEVGKQMKLPPKDVKLRIITIIDRRNKIAHEADADPTNPGFRWPINRQLVNGATDDIERVVEAVFKVVS